MVEFNLSCGAHWGLLVGPTLIKNLLFPSFFCRSILPFWESHGEQGGSAMRRWDGARSGHNMSRMTKEQFLTDKACSCHCISRESLESVDMELDHLIPPQFLYLLLRNTDSIAPNWWTTRILSTTFLVQVFSLVSAPSLCCNFTLSLASLNALYLYKNAFSALVPINS